MQCENLYGKCSMLQLQVIARSATHSGMSLQVLQVIATVHRREHTPVLTGGRDAHM